MASGMGTGQVFVGGSSLLRDIDVGIAIVSAAFPTTDFAIAIVYTTTTTT